MPDYFEYSLITDILIAYEGHLEKLKTLHGTSEKETEVRPITSAEEFKSAFGRKK